MISPISGFAPATPTTTLDYWAIQITGTAQGEQISQALERAVDAGVITNATSQVNKPAGTLTWTISMTSPAGIDSFCTTGDYIVVGADTGGNLTSIAFYNGPNGPYNNPPYVDAFAS